MNHPSFRCPSCGSPRVRRSRTSSLLEMPKRVIGTYPFRCMSCHHRFGQNVWFLQKLKYAKCPNCLSLDLGDWPHIVRHVKPWYRFLLTLGGHGYRCPNCRFNFVSLRPRETAHEEVGTPVSPMPGRDAAVSTSPTPATATGTIASE